MTGASGAARASTSRSGGPGIIWYVVLIAVVALALGGIDLIALRLTNPASRLSPHYYLALGDSLAYGYQPDLNFTSGYADDLFTDLKQANVTNVANYSCGGETTTTMIQGDCIGRVLKHDAYFGPQLAAAVTFLRAHQGQVDPITLDIGSNDVLQDFDITTCSALPAAQNDLATMDTNLTKTILPQLTAAIRVTKGVRTGDLVMLNYYNPFAKECPTSAPFVDQFNTHLAADAAQFRIPVADVYTAFGSDAHQADNICTYTWICNAQFHDLHPTTMGYRVIANAVEQTLGLPGIGPGANPINPGPNLAPPASALNGDVPRRPIL